MGIPTASSPSGLPTAPPTPDLPTVPPTPSVPTATSHTPEVSVQDRNALPQYGFGPDVEFEKLVESNPFLFRVHTPKEPSPFYERNEPYFVGPRFGEDFASSSFHSKGSADSPYRGPPMSTYADVAQHLDWTTRSSSPYVSTSFSFAWAIWEATRRYHHSMKHDIEIAVIDARAVSGRAVTAVELLVICYQPPSGPLEMVPIRPRGAGRPRVGLHSRLSRPRIDTPLASAHKASLLLPLPGFARCQGFADGPSGLGLHA